MTSLAKATMSIVLGWAERQPVGCAFQQFRSFAMAFGEEQGDGMLAALAFFCVKLWTASVRPGAPAA